MLDIKIERNWNFLTFFSQVPINVLLNSWCRYLFCCSYAHNVAPKGKYIAFVLTEAETDKPEEELKPGIDLLGPVDEIFYETYDRFIPTNKNVEDNCFISTVSTSNCLIYSLIFQKKERLPLFATRHMIFFQWISP